MANFDIFFLQLFKTHRTRLVPGQRLPAKTKHHALAEGARLGRTAEGVAVLMSSPTKNPTSLVLWSFCSYGAIPEEFEEEVRTL